MNLLYDYQCFNSGLFNGVSTYFCEIIPLLRDLGYNCSFSFSYSDSVPLREKKLGSFLGTPFFKNHGVAQLLRSYIGRYQSINCLKKKDYDILHSTQYNPYVFQYCTKPVVVTIHDMIQEKFNIIPQDISNKKESIKKADKIIAISENTKRDILHYYPDIDQSKVEVIYHGCNVKDVAVVHQKDNYILYVGQRRRYKNFDFFVKSIAPILVNDRNLKLKCTGFPFSQEEQDMLHRLDIKNQCSSRFYSEVELKTLYQHALCFVYPSKYEGFGLPILDAFANGCPTILSDASCFPEIGGTAATYFNPDNSDDILNTVKEVITSDSMRKEMIRSGISQVKQFTWNKSSMKHAELYKSLI